MNDRSQTHDFASTTDKVTDFRAEKSHIASVMDDIAMHTPLGLFSTMGSMLFIEMPQTVFDLLSTATSRFFNGQPKNQDKPSL